MNTRAPVYMETRMNENDLTSTTFTSPPSETCRIKIERICPAIAFSCKVIGAGEVNKVHQMIKLRWWSTNREQAHRTACLWKERPHKSRQNCTSRTCAVPNHVLSSSWHWPDQYQFTHQLKCKKIKKRKLIPTLTWNMLSHINRRNNDGHMLPTGQRYAPPIVTK